ncbi:MAG: hypothetical protein OEV78_01620 [Spirochaetia bacterium]|nr:hypothetical protein [Spirochaetia bacterium]
MSFNQTYNSNAKINLGLTIPFRYENGYHHIVSLFSCIDTCDVMQISIVQAQSNSFSLSWENNLPPILNDEGTNRVFGNDYKHNLIYKAYEWTFLFLREHGVTTPPFKCHVHIIKKIPSPAGLGGGSSNAAVMIRAIIDFLQISSSPMDSSIRKKIEFEIEKQSLKLGSDIPFFLRDPYQKQTALISGTGEILKKLPSIHLSGIMAIPQFGFSTKQMYQSMDKPISHITRDDIIDIASKSESKNTATRPKKTLHDDNSLTCNLYSIQNIHDDFMNLHDWLVSDDDLETASKNDKSLEKLIRLEEERTYFLNNEFIGISKKLFPDKYIEIEKIRKQAIVKLSQNLLKKNIDGKLISSMSGSGSAIYAGITGKNGLTSEFQKKLDLSVSSLQVEHPEVYWFKFSTLT